MQDVVYFGVLADAHDFFPIERAQSNPDVRVRQVIEVRVRQRTDERAGNFHAILSYRSSWQNAITSVQVSVPTVADMLLARAAQPSLAIFLWSSGELETRDDNTFCTVQ